MCNCYGLLLVFHNQLCKVVLCFFDNHQKLSFWRMFSNSTSFDRMFCSATIGSWLAVTHQSLILCEWLRCFEVFTASCFCGPLTHLGGQHSPFHYLLIVIDGGMVHFYTNTFVQISLATQISLNFIVMSSVGLSFCFRLLFKCCLCQFLSIDHTSAGVSGDIFVSSFVVAVHFSIHLMFALSVRCIYVVLRILSEFHNT